jgi:hypothetical protein
MAQRRRGIWTVSGRVVLALLLVFAGAYGASRIGVFEWPRRYDPLALPDLDEAPHWMTPWQMKLVDYDAAGCVAALNRSGLSLSLNPTKVSSSSCIIENTVTLGRLSRAKIKTEETRCLIAARLYMWERHVVQPEAQRQFGEAVADILHFGSYSCRTIAGRYTMSEHATANAFDISGFRLASGRVISLKRHWRGSSSEQKFLRVVRDGACDFFNTVLSPDYNADHADHFHFDMGLWRTCK